MNLEGQGRLRQIRVGRRRLAVICGTEEKAWTMQTLLPEVCWRPAWCHNSFLKNQEKNVCLGRVT